MDRETWLQKLGEFLLEANDHTWAGSDEDLPGLLPGFKRLEYERGPWRLVDQYSGYFRAPGFTVVYYEGVPAWTQSYGGLGMSPKHYPLAKQVFAFLKMAILANKESAMPFRGCRGLWEKEEDFVYRFHVTWTSASSRRGWWDLLGCEWKEKINTIGGETLFIQTGYASVIIGKGDNGNPVYPWEF